MGVDGEGSRMKSASRVNRYADVVQQPQTTKRAHPVTQLGHPVSSAQRPRPAGGVFVGRAGDSASRLEGSAFPVCVGCGGVSRRACVSLAMMKPLVVPGFGSLHVVEKSLHGADVWRF